MAMESGHSLFSSIRCPLPGLIFSYFFFFFTPASSRLPTACASTKTALPKNTNISPELKECKGYLPPAVLQLLVENAIKHNGFSMENPLFIDITLSDDYITVRNLKSPLLSKMESTGLGHKNIIERYSLLCDKKVKIENAENFYSVSLPIIKKQSL